MQFLSDKLIEVDGERFQLADWIDEMNSLKDEDGFVLVKTRTAVEKYVQNIDPCHIQNVFELGIFRGGSVVFLDRLLQPTRLAAIDISDPVPVLESWIEQQRAKDRIRTFYNVDQADVSRLRDICAQVFADEVLDLVVDDASHFLDQTRASFNTLFPRLRPGGAYIIEDWAWFECSREMPGLLPDFVGQEPMSKLIFDIVIAHARAPHVIEEVLINEGFALVRRGPAELGQDFDVGTYA